jgi:hypothetical protein
VPLRIADYRQRADDQHLPQVAMTLLANATQAVFAAARVCLGTNPIQAARFLPHWNAPGSATEATMAFARTGRTSRISISRRPTSVGRGSL